MKIIVNQVPPSNNCYIGKNKRWEYAAKKKEWSELILNVCRASKVIPKQPLSKATVRLTYYFKTRVRHDPDNYSGKFILDGLVNAGIITDDSFNNITLLLSGDYDKNNPRTEIEVTSDA